jgi:heme/copper-type cytochrome/quinol oxidase subunit 3
MEIPYTVRPRPDTGLANAKLGIWLFLASEVMLFGGLFAGYIFMRLGAEPWMWPHGWLNVPVGTFNTFVLIFSSVTIILSWESLKMKNYRAYKTWLATTWICGLLFLGVKLAYEWPDKFHHFGAYVQADALHKYEDLLGNENEMGEDGKPVLNKEGKPTEGRRARGLSERRFVSGHAEDLVQASIPYISPKKLDDMIAAVWSVRGEIPKLEAAVTKTVPADLTGAAKDDAEHTLKDNKKKLEVFKNTLVSMNTLLPKYGLNAKDMEELLDEKKSPEEQKKLRKEFLKRVNTITLHSVDAPNAQPYDPDNDKAHFMPRSQVEQHVSLDKADLIAGHGAFLPKLNTYLACYFMITGLHGAHVLGGCIMFIYFWLNIKGGSKLYHTNHQLLCNRIEVAGLFWHLVDLVWIFVFPIFYLL